MTVAEYVPPLYVAVSLVEITGDTDSTSGAFTGFESRLTDWVLSCDVRIWVPAVEAPPVSNTVSVFDPRLWIEFSISCELPVPIASSTMTEATPIITPSIVSDVRSQFEVIPRIAIIMLPKTFVIRPRILSGCVTQRRAARTGSGAARRRPIRHVARPRERRTSRYLARG